METPPLTIDQIQRFQADGFVACADFLDAAMHAEVRGWVDEISAWPDRVDGHQHYREQTDRGPVMARTERFLAFHDGMRGFLTAGRIISALGQLFGESAAVFKEKINYKNPGGGGFVPHQDAAAYRSEFGSLHITCLVAIDANTETNGCLWFAPGEHLRGLLPENGRGCLADEVAGGLTWVPATLEPGGVLFFSSFVPHKSSANNSDLPRRSLYITYGKASEGDRREAYYADRSRVMEQHGSTPDRSVLISTISHFQGKTVE
ncbi:MAG: phytanoyl-CoA dioxygenase family protein [Planctomycetota bacterium]|nr:phytanoyl-CoA dioxygenase family protein [Planctomycetota bacterium]